VVEVLYTLARNASRRSSTASWNTHINLGIGKKSHPANLNLSLNSLNSRLEAIEPPGQTAQKKQAELLEKPWRAIAFRPHLYELAAKPVFGQWGTLRVQVCAHVARFARQSPKLGI
jgi:hypothetical protein